MSRSPFNKRSKADLHRLGNLMNAKFTVIGTDELEDADVKFARSVMYWHDHYANKGWALPSWAQMPDFQGWLTAFRESYHFNLVLRSAMESELRDCRDY